MNLYNAQAELIGTIDLRPDIAAFIADGRAFRCAIKDPELSRIVVSNGDDAGIHEDFGYRVLGIVRYRDGVMIVEGSVDDLQFIPEMPQAKQQFLEL